MDTANRSRLQQQPRRFSDRQQQQSSGSREFQPRKSQSPQPSDERPAGQMGEGSYEGARDYQDNIKSYLKKADVESDAKAAKPDSPAQAAELKKAEEEGKSHSKAPGQ
jgi:hypothetical protein